MKAGNPKLTWQILKKAEPQPPPTFSLKPSLAWICHLRITSWLILFK